jgi:hypothetical protein
VVALQQQELGAEEGLGAVLLVKGALAVLGRLAGETAAVVEARALRVRVSAHAAACLLEC